MKKFNIGLLIIGLCFGGFYVYKHVVGNVGCKISKNFFGKKFNYICNKKTVVFDADWIEKTGDFGGQPVVIFAKDDHFSLAIFDEIIVANVYGGIRYEGFYGNKHVVTYINKGKVSLNIGNVTIAPHADNVFYWGFYNNQHIIQIDNKGNALIMGVDMGGDITYIIDNVERISNYKYEDWSNQHKVTYYNKGRHYTKYIKVK